MTRNQWVLCVVALLAVPVGACAQEGAGDVVYVPTPQVVVDEMLRIAKVGAKDFIIDLGSGDGRMVITAAKKFGARGFGVDLDKVLLKISNESAQRENVADRARFWPRRRCLMVSRMPMAAPPAAVAAPALAALAASTSTGSSRW